ncbi:glutaredoxin family protein [Cyanobium sp. HWJ4-Hawea]|uniref:glutaredoxin family protein n=1 Tax=unclassified Cyanobium TaxID=2627006 RepID=UPI0020CFC5AC|nr:MULTISPECIES: glutaredoxin family protein [unclassified Cyanobium]MCP9774107.1 glutaredoxin family protein [Cyanobium sp. WAJ14-Wanaka]MCP9807892.1 glutaredoxin family protein [Cyanobium sp. HWJ4-Hawea]
MGELLLFTRAGCCLCEGLEEKLRALTPVVALSLVDVDGDPALQARYGLEVPVLAIPAPQGEVAGTRPWRELPRVPPRLMGKSLADWLLKNGFPGQGA